MDTDFKDNDQQGSSAPPLNWKNYGNLVGYIINVLFTFGIGTFGWFGLPNNTELSEKYQTIITPKGTAFSIWGLIFTTQLIFVILQMLPSFRGRAIVQKGVSFWYIITCLTQSAWTLAFAFEVNELALAFILSIWASLMACVISQYYVEPENEETAKCLTASGSIEFWLFKFPFSLHGGWLTAASALNVCVVTVDYEASASTQLAVANICLAVLHALSVWHLFGYKIPNYTIPGVLIWANGWIFGELQEPKQLILDTFDQSVIDGVAISALSVAIIISIQVVVRVGFFTFNYLRGKSYFQE